MKIIAKGLSKSRGVSKRGFSVLAAAVVVAGSCVFLHSTKSVSQSATLPLSTPVSPQLQQALLLYQRLGGVNIPIDSTVLTTIANQIGAGNIVAAANTVISSEPNFYDITVREFGAVMSTRAEVQNAPTSDFVADVIGTVRDGLDARQLLVGNFIYSASATAAPKAPTDLVKSNTHYAYLDANNIDLSTALVNSGSQMLVNSSGSTSANPDPAGLLTTYAFMGAHAIMGTNRRFIQYAFREFECIDISDFAENGPDNMVGRDVDRFPGGDDTVYQGKCKLCHNRLDSMRPAVAHFDFNATNQFISNSLFLPGKTPAGTSPTGTESFDPNGIALKYNQNNTVFPAGYAVTSTAWINTATDTTSQNYFGWNGSVQGSSLNEFGAMLANSQRFPRCLAQRVFQSVCKRAPDPTEMAGVEALGDSFASSGYQLKSLFAQVAAMPNCLGLEN